MAEKPRLVTVGMTSQASPFNFRFLRVSSGLTAIPSAHRFNWVSVTQ